MNYFITVKGETVINNLTKKQAIKTALKIKDEVVGIGRNERRKGKLTYTLLPLHFYL